MDATILGVVLDASTVITAERRQLPVTALLEAIRAAHGDIELSLAPMTIAELVHGIFRARTPEIRGRRRAYIHELIERAPTHSMTATTAYLAGEIDATEAEKGKRAAAQRPPHRGCRPRAGLRCPYGESTALRAHSRRARAEPLTSESAGDRRW